MIQIHALTPNLAQGHLLSLNSLNLFIESLLWASIVGSRATPVKRVSAFLEVICY